MDKEINYFFGQVDGQPPSGSLHLHPPPGFTSSVGSVLVAAECSLQLAQPFLPRQFSPLFQIQPEYPDIYYIHDGFLENVVYKLCDDFGLISMEFSQMVII